MSLGTDTWAEEEAFAEACLLQELLEDGNDEDYLASTLHKNTVTHWEKVFDDIADLHKFIDYFNKTISEMDLPVKDKSKFFIGLPK